MYQSEYPLIIFTTLDVLMVAFVNQCLNFVSVGSQNVGLAAAEVGVNLAGQ